MTLDTKEHNHIQKFDDHLASRFEGFSILFDRFMILFSIFLSSKNFKIEQLHNSLFVLVKYIPKSAWVQCWNFITSMYRDGHQLLNQILTQRFSFMTAFQIFYRHRLRVAA